MGMGNEAEDLGSRVGVTCPVCLAVGEAHVFTWAKDTWQIPPVGWLVRAEGQSWAVVACSTGCAKRLRQGSEEKAGATLLRGLGFWASEYRHGSGVRLFEAVAPGSWFIGCDRKRWDGFAWTESGGRVYESVKQAVDEVALRHLRERLPTTEAGAIEEEKS